MTENITKLISESLKVSPEAISYDTVFEDDLGADSLDMTELFLNVEAKLQIELPEEDMSQIITVGELAEYINSHL